MHGGPGRITERVCGNTIELMTRTHGYSDDITMLAAQRVQPPGTLYAEWTARPAVLADALTQIADWLDTTGIRLIERIGVQHAATEMLANAAVHAYATAPTPGPMRLALELAETGDLRITVADEGTWKEPVPGATDQGPFRGGGRGLSLTSSLLDTLKVDRAPQGTTVTGTLRVSRPARVLTNSPGTHLRPTTELPFTLSQEGGRLRVSGAIFQEEADDLDRTLRRVSQGGANPTLVDLTDVTHLCSTAIQVLYAFASTSTITLLAPNGTVAQHVLDLVRLPHER